MATIWIRGELLAWIAGAPETRRADAPLRGIPEEGDEPLYDQKALDAEIKKEREACLAAVQGVMVTDHGLNTWKRCVSAIEKRNIDRCVMRQI